MSITTIFEKKVSLKEFSLMKCGGEADYFYSFSNEEELKGAFEAIKRDGLDYYVFGNGSNIVFSDDGFRGVILKNKMKEIKLLNENELYVETGVMVGKFINFAKNNDFGGVQALTWVPGTIGGAIYGNAGAYGQEISDYLVSVRYFDPEDGEVKEVMKNEIEFAYRTSSFKGKDWIMLSAVFKLPALTEEDEKLIEEVVSQRKVKIPSSPSSGSFFKNPDNEHTGKLIDKLGLKGFKVGGMEVSDMHANIFVNKGEGTQKDLVELAKTVKNKVKEKYNIELHPEVRVIDEHGKIIPI